MVVRELSKLLLPESDGSSKLSLDGSAGLWGEDTGFLRETRPGCWLLTDLRQLTISNNPPANARSAGVFHYL